MKKVHLYIPIELKARELAPKIFFAMHAANNNFRSYIGTQESIMRIIKDKKEYGGAFFFKGGLPKKLIVSIKKKCQNFLVLDEELGVGTGNLVNSMKVRVQKKAEKDIDRYYMIGKKYFLLARQNFKNMRKSLKKTGWPRIDYFIKADLNKNRNMKAKKIKEKYGKYILFISSFGMNSKKMINYTYHRYLKQNNFTKKTLKLKHNRNLNILKEFEKNIAILKKLDSDDKIPLIIVRPHPSEDLEVWRRYSRSFSKIKVISDDDISPWIFSSSAILHKGCTSVIQAYISKKPIGYIVTKKKMVKKDALPFKLSEKLDSYKKISNFCKTKILENKKIKRNKFSKEFLNVIYLDKKYSASELILKDINTLKIKKEFSCKVLFSTYLKHSMKNLLNIFNVYKFFLVRFFLNLFNLNYSPPANRIISHHQKIPFGINKKNIESTINYLMPNNNYSIKKVLNNCYEIDSKGI